MIEVIVSSGGVFIPGCSSDYIAICKIFDIWKQEMYITRLTVDIVIPCERVCAEIINYMH